MIRNIKYGAYTLSLVIGILWASNGPGEAFQIACPAPDKIIVNARTPHDRPTYIGHTTGRLEIPMESVAPGQYTWGAARSVQIVHRPPHNAPWIVCNYLVTNPRYPGRQLQTNMEGAWQYGENVHCTSHVGNQNLPAHLICVEGAH